MQGGRQSAMRGIATRLWLIKLRRQLMFVLLQKPQADRLAFALKTIEDMAPEHSPAGYQAAAAAGSKFAVS